MKEKVENHHYKCNICSKDDFKFLYTIDQGFQRSRVVKCKDCGFSFIDPRPDPDFYKEYYDQDYFTSKKGYRGHLQFEFDRNYPTIRRKSDLFLKHYSGKKGNYLDIGCATGIYVQVFKDMGWNAKGIDISRYSTEYGREERGLDLVTGDLITFPFPSDHFDLITMISVIEHLTDPKRFLKKVAKILSPDGVLAVDTFNSDCFLAKLSKQRWWGYDDGGHIFFFSIKTLEKMLNKVGLEIFAIDSLYSYGWSLRDVLKRKENRNLKIKRSLEYLLITRIGPVSFRFSKSLSNILTPSSTYFIRHKRK